MGAAEHGLRDNRPILPPNGEKAQDPASSCPRSPVRRGPTIRAYSPQTGPSGSMKRPIHCEESGLPDDRTSRPSPDQSVIHYEPTALPSSKRRRKGPRTARSRDPAHRGRRRATRCAQAWGRLAAPRRPPSRQPENNVRPRFCQKKNLLFKVSLTRASFGTRGNANRPPTGR